MDKDRVSGVARPAEGAVKETVGKVTADTRTEVGAATQQTAEKALSAVGGAKDPIRDAMGTGAASIIRVPRNRRRIRFSLHKDHGYVCNI